MFETDTWPLVRARDIGERRTVPVRVIVIHTAETLEAGDSAENLARYGQNPDYPSSWHICVDSNSIVQCVPDSFVAWAAPGVNHDGIQIEICGKAAQSAAGWRDFFSLAALALAADATAQYCLKYDLPPVKLTDAQLGAGAKGIIGHEQATRVYPAPNRTHTDPGPNFPWPRFSAMAQALVAERRLIA
jgi:N-acetyl-anhydromuramyl-L-alanine amidase AmpD